MPESLFDNRYLDIRQITLEQPRPEKVLQFDPEKDVHSEELDWLKEALNNRSSEVGYLHLLRAAKILLPDYVPSDSYAPLDWSRIQTEIENSRREQRQLWNTLGVDLRIAHPQWLEESRFKPGGSYQKVMESELPLNNGQLTGSLTSTQIDTFLVLPIIYPENSIVQQSSDAALHIITQEIQQMYGRNQFFWNDWLTHVFYFRLAYPHLWNASMLTADHWAIMKDRFESTRRSEGREYSRNHSYKGVCDFATMLAVLAAESFQFTEEGLVLTSAEDTTLEARNLPEERKY